MKNLLFLSLFLFSSCALYQELFGPQPKGIPIARPSTPMPIEVPLEAQTFRSTDDAATLLMYLSKMQVVLKTGKMSYRTGHSIEIQLDDDAPVIKQVLATDNHIVQFADSGKVMELMKGKKKIQIELHLDGTGLKIFTFNL